MIDFDLLEDNQVLGEDQFSLFKNYGTKCSASDFAIACGTIPTTVDSFTSEGNTLKNRACKYWIKTSKGLPAVIECDGKVYSTPGNDYMVGVRPVIRYSSIESLVSNKKANEFGITEFECFSYPQTIMPKVASDKLEQLFLSKKMTPVDYIPICGEFNKKYNCYNISYLPVFEVSGQRFVRHVINYKGIIITHGNYDTDFYYWSGKKVSTGTKLQLNKPYWFSIEPIKFLLFEDSDIAIFKNVIFGGIPFNLSKQDGVTYDESFIREYLEHFAIPFLEKSMNNHKSK